MKNRSQTLSVVYVPELQNGDTGDASKVHTPRRLASHVQARIANDRMHICATDLPGCFMPRVR